MDILERLNDFDTNALLFLNGLHNDYVDQFFYLFSQKECWVIALIIFVGVLIKAKKTEAIWILIGLLFTILLSDQICSSIIKPIVERYRPTHEPSIEHLVHIVNGYRGGNYGFCSSHAATSFGIAIFLTLVFKNKLFGYTIFTYAIISSYSRIYLGVHYPGDILCGAIIGILCGVLCYNLLLKFRPQAFCLSKKSVSIDTYHGFSHPQTLAISLGIIITMIVLLTLSNYIYPYYSLIS